MKFKIADDPQFHDRWQALMRSNENLLSILHETLSTPEDVGRLAVLEANVRAVLDRLMALKPVQVCASVFVYHRGAFEYNAAGLHIKACALGPDDSLVDGWTRYQLTAPKERIDLFVSQFKVGVKWQE